MGHDIRSHDRQRTRHQEVGGGSRRPHHPRLHRLLRRVGNREAGSHQGFARHGRADRAEPAEAARLLPASQRAARRGAHRAPDVRVPARAGRCRSQQQLDGAGRGEGKADGVVQGLDEGPHDVRRAVPDGTTRIAFHEGRSRDHRQQVRGPQHAHHDAHRAGGARSPEGSERLHAVPALARRSQSRPPLHHALPGRQHRLVGRIGLRWQRAARQEMFGASPRQRPRPERGMAGRAHADPRPRGSVRTDALHRAARFPRRAARRTCR